MSEGFSTYRKVIVSILILGILFLLIYGLISGNINDSISNFWQIIAPITIGFIISYLTNPVVTFFEKRVFKWIGSFKIRRFVSIFITILLLLLLISIILGIIIPSLINTLISFWESYVVDYENSVRGLVDTINSTIERFKLLNSIDPINPDEAIAWVREKLPWINDIAEGDLAAILPNVSTSVSHNITSILNYALSFGASLFNFIKNFLLGIFIAFYMLMAKERCKAYIRRLLNSFLTPKNVRSVVRFGKLLDRSFGGFIEGQLIDAMVVGIISYLTFLIFGIPIPHLLATIIAVTNVIPIFGPFIGGIPAAFLVLLTAPEKTILFIILIFVIQQIDGNIICPHILGDKINISSLATIIAIITMGGLFGILGMVIGVPIFAVIIHVINDYTMNALRKKGLSTSMKDYYVGNLECIENNSPSVKKRIKNLFSKKKDKSKENVNNEEK